jgi:DNA-binding NtrC family response regulator
MSHAPVLIVDDDDLARLALAEVLQRCGIDVVCVSTPDDARNARECRVIVAELRLTGQTAAEGEALLAELRDRRQASDVVIFSSFLGSEPADEVIPGVAASLPKSTPLREVAATIRTLVERTQ